MKLLLRRALYDASCTLGKLSFYTPAQDFSADTIERPWLPTPLSKGGRKGESCVPTGIYTLEKHHSEAHPNTWALVNSDLDVLHYEDRSRPHARALVLIHVANFARELRGCIAPGFGTSTTPTGERMVTQSRRAMIELKRLLPWDDTHVLEII